MSELTSMSMLETLERSKKKQTRHIEKPNASAEEKDHFKTARVVE